MPFLCTSGRRWPIAIALPFLLAAHLAGAASIDAATMRQPAMAASWASRALILGVARAGSDLVAVGERGFVLRSTDNGHSWRQASMVPTSVTLTNVAFEDASSGWAVGHMGVILRTRDGGERWTIDSDGIQNARVALDRAWALGTEEPTAQAAQLLADGADKPLLSLLVRKGGQMLAMGAFGTGLRREGAQRLAVFEQVINPGMLHIYGLSEHEGRTYAAGEQGLLLRSDNGGSFNPLTAPYKGTFFGTRALPGGVVLAYGLRGTVLRSADNGDSWTAVASGTKFSITSSVALDDGRIVLGSQSGQLAVSADAGLTFSPMAPSPQPVTGLAQAADGALVVAGPRGLSRIALRESK